MAIITVDHVNIFRNFNAVQSNRITKITSCKYQVFIITSQNIFFFKKLSQHSLKVKYSDV